MSLWNTSASHLGSCLGSQGDNAKGKSETGLEITYWFTWCFLSQVSSSGSPQTSLESHVFNVAVLPQTPKAPQLSLGSSLHMAVSDGTTQVAGVGVGKKQIRRVTGVGGCRKYPWKVEKLSIKNYECTDWKGEVGKRCKINILWNSYPFLRSQEEWQERKTEG